jgi:putative transcriptional regulator
VKTRIKEFRARYDLTQEGLAKLVGVRRETIVFLEKGKYMPSLRLAHDVAVALKTTTDELFVFATGGGEGQAQSGEPSDSWPVWILSRMQISPSAPSLLFKAARATLRWLFLDIYCCWKGTGCP